MTGKKIRKTIIITLSSLLFLFIVLCVHIYVMMKPRPASDRTVAIARIDFKQDINQADANKISAWLYAQKGVQHVLCNQQTNIAVFSFYPVKLNADKLTQELSSTLNYKAERYKPDQKDLMKSCPVMSSGFSGTVYKIMSKIF